MNKLQPIRMCITCRTRYPKRELIRLKEDDKKLVQHNGTGRSLYICSTCLENEKKIKGLMKRFTHTEESFIKLLKESIKNG